MIAASSLHLGLIGDNIANSRSPVLQRLAGDQHGIVVTYDRLIPKSLDETFVQVFARCRSSGYRGINVTYPYKERVMAKLKIVVPLVRAIGAVNTVVFNEDGPTGHNTDYSGFIAAYRSVRKDANTGTVLLIGTGGVGRAVAFGLAALGATELRLVDRDMNKAKALSKALKRVAPNVDITIWLDAARAAEGATGIINCTPVGMAGIWGTPLVRSAMTNAEWAFDAVYTPVNTQFLNDATATGLMVISGWEMFFYQGIHAWEFFSNLPLNADKLRDDLLGFCRKVFSGLNRAAFCKFMQPSWQTV